MPVTTEEIRRSLVEFASQWSLYAAASAPRRRRSSTSCSRAYGTDRRALGARFEEAQDGKFLDLHLAAGLHRRDEAPVAKQGASPRIAAGAGLLAKLVGPGPQRARTAVRGALRVSSLRGVGARRLPGRAPRRVRAASNCPSAPTRSCSSPAASRCSRPRRLRSRARRSTSSPGCTGVWAIVAPPAPTSCATSCCRRCGACSPKISVSSKAQLFTPSHR